MPGSNWRPSACKADVITTTPTDQHGGQRQNYEKYLAERGFDPRTSGLWAQHASTAPLCYLQQRTANRLPPADGLQKYDEILQKYFVRSGIRTHAHRSGLRPERSALDLSAILTHTTLGRTVKTPVGHQGFWSRDRPISVPHHRGPFSSVG